MRSSRHPESDKEESEGNKVSDAYLEVLSILELDNKRAESKLRDRKWKIGTYNYNPLDLAIICEDPDMVNDLMVMGFSVSIPLVDRPEIFFLAACENPIRNQDVIKLKISQNVNVNCKNAVGYRPLEIMANNFTSDNPNKGFRKQDFEVFKLIIIDKKFVADKHDLYALTRLRDYIFNLKQGKPFANTLNAMTDLVRMKFEDREKPSTAARIKRPLDRSDVEEEVIKKLKIEEMQQNKSN